MAYTQDQYLGFAQQLAPYLSDPTQLMQQAGKLGLGVEDVAKAAQTFNPNITASQIQSYFQPAGPGPRIVLEFKANDSLADPRN